MPVLMWFAPAGSRSVNSPDDDAEATAEAAAAAIDAASSADSAFKLFARFVPKERFRFITATYAIGLAVQCDPMPPPGDFGETLYIPYAGGENFHSSLVLRGPRSSDRLDTRQYEVLMRLGKTLQKRLGELATSSKAWVFRSPAP